MSTIEKLSSIKNVISVEKKSPINHFDEYYEIWFKQPIDHNNKSKGFFNQRVLLGFESYNLPVIVELEGYGINSKNAGELTAHYKVNELIIEHRYFNHSRPETIDWNTLTLENAAKDQNVIINVIRDTLFPKSKFITTGVSKGCQTTMAHRRFFPNAVDASVCYVGPLNYKREDSRVYNFLKTVASQEERDKVMAFQNLCFENKAELLQKMKDEALAKDMSWEFGVDKAIEYTILQYAFSFWQWGKSTDDIPTQNASITTIYEHLIEVSGYDFFEQKSVNKLQAYFWTALTQQGIYGYETAPFKSYLNTEAIYTFDWAFPENVAITYDLKPMQDIKQFLDTSAENMLFIYGEYDPWTALAVELNASAEQREVYKFVKPKGDHRTKIIHFSEKMQQSIYNIINGWLYN
nr:S28 family serine protease [uncultured Psychroserpens sp.]